MSGTVAGWQATPGRREWQGSSGPKRVSLLCSSYRECSGVPATIKSYLEQDFASRDTLVFCRSRVNITSPETILLTNPFMLDEASSSHCPGHSLSTLSSKVLITLRTQPQTPGLTPTSFQLSFLFLRTVLALCYVTSL